MNLPEARWRNVVIGAGSASWDCPDCDKRVSMSLDGIRFDEVDVAAIVAQATHSAETGCTPDEPPSPAVEA